ncbi:DUF6247 family protein [Streptomyces sp. NPDC093225]|uniref:DUF6247 family protein n=1 Tax=Streptomyces sp. NPDC093225 TaxID=3366034 RepID=UPI0038003D9A
MPAFDRDWNAALEESRATFDLTALYDVVREWAGASGDRAGGRRVRRLRLRGHRQRRPRGRPRGPPVSDAWPVRLAPRPRPTSPTSTRLCR